MANNRKRSAGSNAEDEKQKRLSKAKNGRNDASETNPCPFHCSPAFPQAIKGSCVNDNIQSLPQDCILDILTWVPLSELFGILCLLGTLSEIVWTCPQFQNEWDEHNMEMCLVVNHRDVVSMVKFSDWIWSKNILHEWINNSTWSIRAAAGGFLVFINEQEGKLQAMNLLTMKVHQIPDLVVNSRCRLSFYIKKHPKEVGVELREDLRTKSCEVIVMGNFTRKKLHLLIYSLTNKTWELKVPQNSVSLKRFSKILVHEEKVYCFSQDLRTWASYNIHEGERLHYVRFSIQRGNGDALNKALVVCKGKIMKFELKSLHQYAIFVLDDHMPSHIPPVWRSVFEERISISMIPFRVSENFLAASGGDNDGDNDGDDIWVLFEGNNRMMSVDLDAQISRRWKCPKMYNLTSKNSNLFCMPLKFSPSIKDGKG